MLAILNRRRSNPVKLTFSKIWEVVLVSRRDYKFLSEQGRIEAEKGKVRDQVDRLVQAGVDEGAQTYAHLLLKCGDYKLLAEGERLHATIYERWRQRPERLLLNCLVEMYGKCGSLDKAWLVFSSIKTCNVYSWTIAIAAFAVNGDYSGALALFRKMDLDGVKANFVTYVNVISACSGLLDPRECKRVHSRVVEEGFDRDLVVATALVTMYGKCADFGAARMVFEKISSKNDVVSWNALIAAYAQQGLYRECVELYERMPVRANEVTFVSVVDAFAGLGDLEHSRRVHARIVEDGLENDCLKSALVDAYGKCGSPAESKQVFDSMVWRESSTWNALIAAFAQQRDSVTCVAILRQMDQDGVRSTELTFVSLLGGFSTTASLRAGRQLHSRVLAMGFYSDLMVGSALVTMYGRCGAVDQARAVFDGMEERNAVSFNSMIGAYAELGLARQALEVLWAMDQPCGVAWRGPRQLSVHER
ncbi:pentatricopeptide repeat-containing protein At2g13600 [Selaginella moellendorffii]|uniref:pentatricopeptide repeat-containing protein At2g13600 n=1 Tax=Selaginella moellendorffii TaxID=88036 RepID=UPI000D1C4DAB|nr:pentatricopeptide repeat-containing protein At2g13600 [Selaginella moellendorffii]|eukprot:XP_024518382.1 pentatricopeptide repeat-containing protein At2g13600 [Selaginella moellendorffii]